MCTQKSNLYWCARSFHPCAEVRKRSGIRKIDVAIGNERVYDDRYQQQYGRWHPVIGEAMRKYLDCGDLHRGFARLGCNGCRYHHPGFSAYEGTVVSPDDSAARERLASYLVHAPFSLDRLHYDRDAGAVTLDALAASMDEGNRAPRRRQKVRRGEESS